MEKKFKIKSPIETYSMLNSIVKEDMGSYKAILEYISELESNLATYQMALDHIKYCVDTHNVNAER